MSKDQEEKLHACRFCKQSFSNGKKLGGHMRSHLALISAIRKKGLDDHRIKKMKGFGKDDHDIVNSETGLEFDDGYDKMVKKSQYFDYDYANGRKKGVRKNDQDLVNGNKGRMVKKSQLFDQDYSANGRKKGVQENDQDFVNGNKGKMVKKSQLFDQDYSANGRKKGVQANDQDFVNGNKVEMVKKNQRFDQDYSANGIKKGVQESDQDFVSDKKGLKFDNGDNKLVKKSQHFDSGANGRKKRILGRDQEVVSDENGIGFDDDYDDEKMVKKSQQEMDVDQDYDDQEYGANSVYGLRENPKRSWRVSNSISDFGIFCKECGKEFDSLKALARHKRCHLRNESVSNKSNVCEKCGKGFDSMKALYGHMRCHSIKRSQLFDASEDDVDDDDGGLANPIRKKRSCTRYKSPKPNHVSTSLSSCYDDYEVEEGAICLMMLSRGVRSLHEVKLVTSHEAEFALSGTGYGYPRTLEDSVEFDVSVDGSLEYGKFKTKNDLGLKKDLSFESGWDQLSPGCGGSAVGKCKSAKKPRLCDQDFGERDDTDSKISFGLKRKSKNHICAICFKEFGSKQALGSHKRVHNKTANKTVESDDIPHIHGFVDLNRKGGVKNSDVEFKLTWVHSEIDRDPIAVVN